jgi:hypothetical protein
MSTTDHNDIECICLLHRVSLLINQEPRIVLKTKEKCYLLIDASCVAHDAKNGSAWIPADRKMKKWWAKSVTGNDYCSWKMVIRIHDARLSQGLIACFDRHCPWQPRSLAESQLLRYLLNACLIQPDRFVNGLAWHLHCNGLHCPPAWFDNLTALAGNLKVPH